MTRKIIIGYSENEIARWQANFLRDQLGGLGIDSEIKIIKGKGVQIKESLLKSETDVTVHSLKKLRMRESEALCIAGVSLRDDPSEALLINPEARDEKMPLGFRKYAVVGTSSDRRKAQIRFIRPDIELKDLTGDALERVKKLRDGKFDAIILANAEISWLKLDLSGLVVKLISPCVFIPAPAQGVLAYQCRANDEELVEILAKLSPPEIKDIVDIERGILSQFGGDLEAPVGVFAEKSDGGYKIRVNFESIWEHFPNRITFNASTVDDALKKFKSKLNPEYPKRILITKHLDRDSFLKRAAIYKNFSIVEMPFVETRSAPFEFKDANDWIFFSSTNAVQHFFEAINPSSIAHRHFACLGEATARKLAKYVDHIDFFGTGNSIETGERFAKIIESDTVLFPISDISLKSVQKYLPDAQVDNLIVYNTIHKKDLIVPQIDGIIFSSPSNIDAWFANQALRLPALVIAMGPSTSANLEKRGIEHRTAKVPHEAELFNLVAH